MLDEEKPKQFPFPGNVGHWKLKQVIETELVTTALYEFGDQEISFGIRRKMHDDFVRSFFNVPAMYTTTGCGNCGHSH